MIPVITGTVGESCQEFIATIRAVVTATTGNRCVRDALYSAP